MAVHNYLDLSTSHLPQSEMQNLDEIEDLALVKVIDHEYGAWVHVPSTIEEIDSLAPELSRRGFTNLVAVLKHALDLDCWWINFDQDGEVDPVLQSWEW